MKTYKLNLNAYSQATPEISPSDLCCRKSKGNTVLGVFCPWYLFSVVNFKLGQKNAWKDGMLMFLLILVMMIFFGIRSKIAIVDFQWGVG